MRGNHKRFFNTSGPCNPERHYALFRKNIIKKGINLVEDERYFTIWAPRQTGKSTYFRLLKPELEKLGYKVVHINVESFKNITESNFLKILDSFTQKDMNIEVKARNFDDFFNEIVTLKDQKIVLIIDEIEGLNPAIFNQFLHTIRNLYHFREENALKSVIFVGVSNILGVIQDNASPFNIADNLDVPYFTEGEVFELLEQHETETGQKFATEVKAKIYEITSGQPGLVNGFAYKLVTDNLDKTEITLADYYKVERWYLYIAIDKNIENIKNKAKLYRRLMEELLFTEKTITFNKHKESIKFLSSQGVIQEGEDGNIQFWVPLYKKVLYTYFSPDFNGEGRYFYGNNDPYIFYDEETQTIKLKELINMFKQYVKERSFKHFMDRSADGSYERLKEAAAGYAFSTYIENYVRILRGNTYYEADSGLGRTDMIINALNHEYIIEFKVFSDKFNYQRGKQQVSYYAQARNLTEAYYVVFAAKKYQHIEYLKDSEEIIYIGEEAFTSSLLTPVTERSRSDRSFENLSDCASTDSVTELLPSGAEAKANDFDKKLYSNQIEFRVQSDERSVSDIHERGRLENEMSEIPFGKRIKVKTFIIWYDEEKDF